jgi:hypothetical protein
VLVHAELELAVAAVLEERQAVVEAAKLYLVVV